MKFTTALPIVAALAAPALAEIDLDGDEIPTQCNAVCDPLLNLVRQCNVDDDVVGGDQNEDLLERQCVCTNTSFDVANVAALCASCMEQNVREREDLEDINDLMRACNFQSSSFAPEATTIVEGVTVTATRPTDINQLTTTAGSQPTGSNNDNNNNNNNNNNDGGNSGSIVSPGMAISLAGAAVVCAMLMQ
jgi:hypothetical protein